MPWASSGLHQWQLRWAALLGPQPLKGGHGRRAHRRLSSGLSLWLRGHEALPGPSMPSQEARREENLPEQTRTRVQSSLLCTPLSPPRPLHRIGAPLSLDRAPVSGRSIFGRCSSQLSCTPSAGPPPSPPHCPWASCLAHACVRSVITCKPAAGALGASDSAVQEPRPGRRSLSAASACPIPSRPEVLKSLTAASQGRGSALGCDGVSSGKTCRLSPGAAGHYGCDF